MPLFMSEDELQALDGNHGLVAEKADAYIRTLMQQLEAHKARADAAAIMAEQRGAVVEQKFLTMSSQFKRLETEKVQLEQTLERRATELAEVQAQTHAFELRMMKQDSDKERLLCELNEARCAKRELLEVVEQKNAEMVEKNTSIKGYLDKIVSLTDQRSILEGKVREAEAEVNRSQAVQARLQQEKEILEQHNSWLNEELTEKIDMLLKERRAASDVEMDLRSKLMNSEQACKEFKESLQRTKEQAKDLDIHLTQIQEELKAVREDAATKEDHLSQEIETASKLAELYKESSEEWSKKAADLEAVIKALEVHLNQVDSDYKDRLQMEVESHKASEKRAMILDEKIEKLEKELEALKGHKEENSWLLLEDIPDRASKDLSVSDPKLAMELHEDGLSLPVISRGVSGTSLAAALLREGWSLTKVYIKYQEAVDAWRHERQERTHAQNILQRVLEEIEQRAELILEERAEHARMSESYALIEDKLHKSIDEQNSLQNQIMQLKAELRKQVRELDGARLECSDLQTQIAVLLKECEDMRLRLNGERVQMDFSPKTDQLTLRGTVSDVISDQQLTFKDIHELVEQNSHLRAVVRTLEHQNDEAEAKLKEAFQLELRRRTDEAAQKVASVIKRSEEQLQVIASLQGMMGMYKRLYEELRSQVMADKGNGVIGIMDAGKLHSVGSGDELQTLVARSQEDAEKLRKDAAEQILALEKDLNKARQDMNLARAERDRLILEVEFLKEQLQRFMKESENQRKEMDGVLARNVEFSQIITDYQKRIRENSDHVQSVEDKSRRLSVEVSVLEREKELISNAEKRASQEVSSLSDRVHRLQATLDSIETVNEAQQNLKSAEKKRLEDEINRMQREWVDMKHELETERAHSRHLSYERDQAAKETMDHIQSISKDLADALKKVSVAETQRQLAQSHASELEASLKKAEEKILLLSSQRSYNKDSKDAVSEPGEEIVSMLEKLEQAEEQINRLTEELNASKNHVDQYKRLAKHNEDALVDIQKAYNTFKDESEKSKEFLNSELLTKTQKIEDIEKQLIEKEVKLSNAIADKEEALRSAEKELAQLREIDAGNRILLEQADERIKALRNELEKEHQQWRSSQNNYERQVLLQADTIRELTKMCEQNSVMEKELLELRRKVELTDADFASSRISWEMEKASLNSEVDNLSLKIKELQDQNRILLDQVEVSHKLLRTEQGIQLSSEKSESDIQDVVRFLRRSKEASDVEITFLKQERLRLQKQLESALAASEEAEANLRREHANTRLTLCSEEEFKSLQAQVREMVLLRESNEQLRLENKRNFEECQNLHVKLHGARENVEELQKVVREREVELEATIKDIDLQKSEASRWESRTTQLLEKYRTFDLEDYNQLQSQVSSLQDSSRALESELDTAKGQIENLQGMLENLNKECSLKDEKIAEFEKKAKDSEVSSKNDIDKYRKQVLFFKRKSETISKEKDESIESLSKQLEELRANANKKAGDAYRSESQIRQEVASQHEQAQKESEILLREKDSRIQILERTLEREREELKKDKETIRLERQRRLKDRQAYMDACAKLDNDKQKLIEELTVLKREKENSEGKKAGRKIVRPKIESPVEAHVQAEVNDVGGDTLIEAGEAEIETHDELKPAPELVEIVSTVSVVNVASIGPGSESTGIRKRQSSQAHGEESMLGNGQGNEGIPSQKRQRGIESEKVLPVTSVAQESLGYAEPVRTPELEFEQGTTADVTPSERVDMSTAEFVEEISVEDVSIRGQIAPRDQTSLRRPRIVRSDIMPSSSERDTIVVALEPERDERVPATEEHVSEHPFFADQGLPSTHNEECMEVDIGASVVPSHRTEDMEALADQTASETAGMTVQSPLKEGFASSELDESESLVVVLGEVTEAQTGSAGAGTYSEGVPLLTGNSEEVIPQELPSTNSHLPVEALDVEDGEIEPDETNEANNQMLTQQPSLEVIDEDKNGDHSHVEKYENDEGESSSQMIEGKPVEKNEPSQSGTSADMSVSESIDGDHNEKSRSPIMTRFAGRGSPLTVERTRERPLNRRGSSMPVSPGRRIARGGKRAIGLQRGRINAHPEEQQGKSEVSQRTDSQTVQKSENVDDSKEQK
ncbi:hypothetical protein KP509_23G046200 [Ceratopteris richardii]|uniref:Nucleoprotein TPR/MLP1 domain-containing protein n=2 Tax=Ceratopteris richardii TaxID=49495 RepID=A0A8T2RZF1_CERRI|nr:hypothetical protein KP509_23G046200 [Ceratopteris richardii]